MFESLLNSYKFSIGFILGIYNSKSSGNLELGECRHLFLLNLSVTLQSLESFGLHEASVLYFQIWMIGNYIWIIGKSAEWLIGPGP
jgi:hypothetical protein